MRQRSRVLLLAAVTAVVIVFALIVLLDRPATRSPAPSATTGVSAAENASSSNGFAGALLPGHVAAPDFTLTDQHGRHVSLAQYRGRVALLTFSSTACRPTCPLIAQQIRGALDELGRAGGHPIPTLIVSADPRADTPARVKRFLDETGLAGRVSYLTGTDAELGKVWRAYGVVPAELGNANSPHAASVLLIDRAGEERDLFQVEQLTPETLAHDVRKLEGVK